MELCRLCYSEITLHLYRTVFNTENEPPFLDILKKLIDLNISKDDQFSKVMCLNCYDKLMNFHQFLQVIKETDAKFRQKFNNDTNSNNELLVQVKKEKDWGNDDDDDMATPDCDMNVNIHEISDDYYSATIKEEINTDQIVDIDKYDREHDNHEFCTNDGNQSTMEDASKICEIKGYTCTYCWKVFKFKSYLKRHLRIHEKSYKCDVCDQVVDISNLNEHKKLHMVDKPYECNICQKRFPYRSYLTKHSKIHLEEKPYKCNICNRGFVRTYNLNKHKRLHNGDKTYKCSTCNQIFLQFSELNNHKLVHSEKLYECKVCSKKFIFQGNLIRHSKIHSGKKSHKCNFCGKRFIQKCTLTRHLTMHNDNNKYDIDVNVKDEIEEKPTDLL